MGATGSGPDEPERNIGPATLPASKRSVAGTGSGWGATAGGASLSGTDSAGTNGAGGIDDSVAVSKNERVGVANKLS